MVLGARYELKTQLGVGGFGAVWRAHDQRLGRDVAVKLLNLEGPAEARFEREARALAQLNHANIVTAHDFGVDGDRAYLVMELIDGRSLADVIESLPPGSGGLPIPWVLSVAEQILSGLAAAHAVGFVHRDLKPQNIMLMADGRRIKIVDFGIAYVLGTSRLTQTGTVIGSLPYISPEQLNGETADARADLYSLGCVLHELLTGASPYRADTPASWIGAHALQAPERVRDRVPSASESLDEFVFRLLAKSPADRPQSAVDALAELQALMSETGPLATLASSAATAVLPPPPPPVDTEPRPLVATPPRALTLVESAAPAAPYPGPYQGPYQGPLPSVPQRPAPPPKPSRAKLWLAAAIILVLVGVGVVVALNLGGKKSPSTRLGQTPGSSPAVDPSKVGATTAGPGDSPSPSTTPSGSPAANANAHIQMTNAGKNDECLHENIVDGVAKPRDGVHLGPCTDKTAASWTFNNDGTIANDTSGNCLAVSTGKPYLGGIGIILLPCDHTDNAQVWDQSTTPGKIMATVPSGTVCMAADKRTIDRPATSVYGVPCADDSKQNWGVSR